MQEMGLEHGSYTVKGLQYKRLYPAKLKTSEQA